MVFYKPAELQKEMLKAIDTIKVDITKDSVCDKILYVIMNSESRNEVTYKCPSIAEKHIKVTRLEGKV